MSRKIQNKQGVTIPYSISQNFLTSGRAIRRLLSQTSITRQDHVLEIGAGKGHITRELAERCGRVTAYEIDQRLASTARAALSGRTNVKLNTGDFLQARLPFQENYKIFANIPFSLTSQILRKIAAASNPAQEVWLVVEYGAAKRVLGVPRESGLSLAVKPVYAPDILRRIDQRDFHPRPGVNCVLLHLLRKTEPDIPLSQRAAFLAFVQRACRDGLSRLLTKKQIAAALRQAELPEIAASGEILYVQWLCLFRCYAIGKSLSNGKS